MLSLAVVALNPGHDDAFGLLEGLEVMQPDTFLLQGPEESLDDPVVLWRGAGDELLGDRKLLSGTPCALSRSISARGGGSARRVF